MGVGQIRPVVKCRAPHRAVRGSPAARGKTKRSSPAAVGLRCDAADSPVPLGERKRAEPHGCRPEDAAAQEIALRRAKFCPC